MMDNLKPSEVSDDSTYFVDVILPVPIPQYFTYRVPRSFETFVSVGCRVVVEFGKGRILTAVIASVHTNPPLTYKAKYLLEILEDTPSVTSSQIWLFNWVADYYMCNVGEVMNVALPAGLKITSQSKVQFNPDFEYHHLLDETEKLIVEELQKVESLSYEELGRLVATEDVTKIIKQLVAKHAIIVFEEVNEKYKPKIEKKIRLASQYEGSDEVLTLIDSLSKNQKQLDILLKYLSKVPIQDLGFKNKEGIKKSIVKEDGGSDSALKTLITKGVFFEFEQVVSRFAEIELDTSVEIKLSEPQQTASTAIMQAFNELNVVLFRGITGSGKTEIYIDIIQKVIDSGSQVLMLLPEIALTTQIVTRLKRIFGEGMGVYHSKFSDNERVEIWNGVLNGRFQFVVGVRSAVFLPFKDLGLIIVDEEHETSYKQHDPAPRYHARDVAIVMAQKSNTKVLLGSATPALESYFQAKAGKYGLVELLERYGDAQLPEIELIDLKLARKAKDIKKEFSGRLLSALESNIKNKEQSIIFLNRRGYAPYLNCQECNWIGQCDQCAVTLTYHMGEQSLVCHYCGHKQLAPKVCPDCSSPRIKSMGVGTEKIEDDLREFFPEAGIIRMDMDTTRNKNAYQQIIGAFETGDIDILVGTQMVSKGLDFDRVSLVGVFNADKMIHFPDFRSGERAYQLITQVSGRAGRRNVPGKVLIQTQNPQNRILQFILNNDYEAYYNSEIADRESFNYPPFSRLIEIQIKDVSQLTSHKAAEALTASLRKLLGPSRILGPEKALVERVRNKFIFEIWVKLEKDKINVKATKEFLQKEKINILSEKQFKSTQIIFNVDAV